MTEADFCSGPVLAVGAMGCCRVLWVLWGAVGCCGVLAWHVCEAF